MGATASSYRKTSQNKNHGLTERVTQMAGFVVKVYRKYYLDSEVYEGDNNGPSTRVYEDEYEGMHAVDVVRMCTEYGLTFEGARWAHQVDGPCTVNYAKGEEMEVTLHLEGCPERVERAIREAVS